MAYIYTCFVCNWRSDEYPPRSYHRVPLKNELRQKWLDNLGKSNDEVGKRAFLCCVHFQEDCFRYGLDTAKRVLKGGSLPTLFLTENEIGDATVIPNRRIIIPDYSVEYIVSTSHPTEHYIKEELTYEMDEENNNEISIENALPTISSRQRQPNDYPPAECVPSTSHATENYIKEEPTYEMDDGDNHVEVPMENQFQSTSSDSAEVKPFIHNTSFTLNTESQSSDLVHTPLLKNEDSFSASEYSTREDSSFFRFFRHIYSDYVKLSAKRQTRFKEECLDALHTLIDYEFTNRRSNGSPRDSVSNLSSFSEDAQDVKALVDHDYEYVIPK